LERKSKAITGNERLPVSGAHFTEWLDKDQLLDCTCPQKEKPVLAFCV